MTTGSMLFDAWIFILMLGLLLYWVFIAPRRYRRQQERRGAIGRGLRQEWDPNIYSGRRNR